jgi:predicted permease
MGSLRDIRSAVRMLSRDPGFSLFAVVLLAVGIAAAPAVFSVASALFWNAVDAPNADRLVRVFIKSRDNIGGQFAYTEFRQFRDHASSFAAMAAEYPTAPLNIVADNESREHNGAVVTANYFSMLGVNPVAGRFFLADEDVVPSRDPVAVISSQLWHSRFGGDPSTVGREISINGTAFHVIGIAPESFKGDEPGIAASELWIPTAMLRVGYRWCDAYADPQCGVLHIIARLAPGKNANAAQNELSSIATAQRLPSIAESGQIVVLPAVGVRPEQQSNLAPQIGLVMALALMLLVIACANVAGLLLARGIARRREVAVRLALGARPLRVIAQLLTENLVLAMMGAVAGVLLGVWIRRAFVSLYTLQSEGGQAFYDIRFNGRMWLFSAAAALGTGLLFGLLPAIRSVHADMIADLKSGGGSVDSATGGRLRDVIAAAQVALSLMLLVVAGLMVRSVSHILSTSFDPDHVAIMRLRPRLVQYSAAQADNYFHAIADRLPSISGVESVGYAIGGSGLVWMPTAGLPMKLTMPTQPETTLHVLPVNNDFFATLRIPVLQGRVFNNEDRPGTGLVLVVNQSAARRFWPEGSAIGRELVLDGNAYRVVGVVADSGVRNLEESEPPHLYAPFWQSTPGARGDMRLAIRVRGDATSALPQLHRAIAAVDPFVPIAEEMALVDQIESEFSTVWLARTTALWCGFVALLLSAAGLYGVLAFVVRSRTREIGLRMALGARPSDVLALIVRRGLVICAGGAVVGLLFALASWRLLSSLLYGVNGVDAIVFAAGPVALLLVGFAASYLPARRAARIDPMVALRHD